MTRYTIETLIAIPVVNQVREAARGDVENKAM